jgi:acetolactate synthase I/II/III large subunit
LALNAKYREIIVAADEPDGASGKRVSGGRALVQALKNQGVDRIYCVPGESYLPVLDALYDFPDIALVSARHEGAAANMAEADGKLTGRPGICFVTRGPGATHAAVGIHTAFQDSTPMVLFIGQVARDARDREGFQEVNFRAMFAPLAKWVAEIDDAARIPEYVARAFQTAMSGRAGPVVLSLPEDTLTAEIPSPPPSQPAVSTASAPRPADLERLTSLLGLASRPILIVGGSGWTSESCQALTQFAQRNALPVVASFRRQDLIDNRHENYCGHLGLGVNPKLAERVRTADLIVAIGSRLSENTTGGYTLLTPPTPAQTLVHVHPDPNEPGRVYHPALAMSCGPAEFSLALAGIQIPGREQRENRLRTARAEYLAFSAPAAAATDKVDLSAVVAWLNGQLKDDAIIANGAGNYTIWVHRYFRYRQLRTELAPISGAMGYGVPAAIAAQLRFPKREVVAFAGDGCFLMYPQELATAVQHHANLTIIIVNNGQYGTIRMHQERRYPGRPIATDIVNPDFVALGQSFGAYAERVSRTDQFPDAYRRAAAAGRPAVLELMVDPAQSTPSLRLA